MIGFSARRRGWIICWVSNGRGNFFVPIFHLQVLKFVLDILAPTWTIKKNQTTEHVKIHLEVWWIRKTLAIIKFVLKHLLQLLLFSCHIQKRNTVLQGSTAGSQGLVWPSHSGSYSAGCTWTFPETSIGLRSIGTWCNDPKIGLHSHAPHWQYVVEQILQMLCDFHMQKTINTQTLHCLLKILHKFVFNSPLD